MATKAKTTKSKLKLQPDYYCLIVRRHYESIWRAIGKYDTAEQAQAVLEEKQAYVGTFNYTNADLKVVSRTEAKALFGADWEYKPIGGEKAPKPKRVTNIDDIF